MLDFQHADEIPRALRHLLESDKSALSDELLRRSFLKVVGATGLAIGLFPRLSSAQAVAGLKASERPSAFLQISTSGLVTVTINRLEFGQGVQTGLPMILAEELDADWSLVRSKNGTNDPAYQDPRFGMHITGGSNSIKNSFTQYRELGARARAMLLAAAAKKWNVDVASLRTQAGNVLGADGRKASYGELAEPAMSLPVPETVVLKDPKDFRIIGRPTVRIDAKAKSSGKQDFGIDVRLPGMLTAVVSRPPVFGAKLRTLDDEAARAIKGVKAVLRVPLDGGAEGVAVVAEGYWTAKLGRDALKAQWDLSAVEKVDSVKQLAAYKEMAGLPGPRHFDADMAPLNTAPNTIEAEFVFPYIAHAPMEPLNCTVQLLEGRAQLWVGTQFPGADGAAAARVLNLKPEQVQINVQTAGGGFGRRGVGSSDFVVLGCEVAKAARAAGLSAPIRTLWSREDDIKGGYYRPMHFHRARIGFDEGGNVLAWDHVLVGQSIVTGTMFGGRVKNGVDPTATEGMRAPYPIPMRLTVHHPKVNVPVLWWRSVGSTHTAFVMETLIDEIARSTKQDPVAYRMKLFGQGSPRHRAALELAVEKSGYGKATLPSGRAWGVAVHECFSSVVAYVVEASVKDGSPVLNRVTAGVHCNLAVNPLSVEAQVQGAALMGLSMCLPGCGEITLKDGEVEQSNFGDFGAPRITDMPDFAVHVVPSAEPPTGIGEPGLPPLAPAFANAIARLTGKPIRQLPFRLS